MSRSTSKFADFFPSAPSVLQQRKSLKAADSPHLRTGSSDSAFSNALAKETFNQVALSSTDLSADQLTKRAPGAKSTTLVATQEEGDLLSGSGSASSASTSSSVFSTNLNASAMSYTNGIHSHALTPLTNTDISPNSKIISPTLDDNHAAAAADNFSSTLIDSVMTPQRTPPTPRRPAREAGLVVKGSKCLYDPDLDKKLGPKDKRKLKAQYMDFGTSVEDNQTPSDPRLTIPNYTRGGAGKQKSKVRIAPYTLRPWQQDRPTQSAPGLPTMVVVTGFDPMAPLAQIMALLSMFGEIGDIDNKTDPRTGRFLGICNVSYQDCSSFQGGGPISAVLAAKQAYLEGKKGQRIGLKTVKIEVDRDGTLTEKLVQKAIAVQRRESGFNDSPVPTPITKSMVSTPAAASSGPPPTAPKGPAAKSATRPPPPHATPAREPYPIVVRPERPGARPSGPSLVERSPIIEEVSNQPHIFLAHGYVPVLSTTIPHLKKRMRMFDWRDIRCDESGYFITFENSRNGQLEAKKTFQGCHMHPLFTYTMNLELRLGSDGNTDGVGTVTSIQQAPLATPAPFKSLPDRVPRPSIKQRREHDMDMEEEKRQRARDLDPSRAVLQMVIQELRDKLLEDVKSRIAAPVLYDFLDPSRHVDKRRRLGINDPDGGKRQGYGNADEVSSIGTPDSRADYSFSGRRPLAKKNLNILSLPKIGKRAGTERGGAGFRDERRKAPARKAIRPLFHQLAQFSDDSDSDDEHRTSLTRDTEDLESRPPSRMSMTSMSEDEDDMLRKVHKKRFHAREESDMGDHIVKDEPDIPKTTADDLIIAKLEHNIYEMSPSSRKRKRLVKELEARKRQREDDELFGLRAADEDSVDIKMADADTPTEQTPDVDSDVPKSMLKKPRPKPKKTKKQIAEEREVLRRAQMEAEAEAIVENVLEFAEEEEAQAEAAERRPEVEWGVSASTGPQPTVDDDESIVPDLCGWQASLCDDEDLHLLSQALRDKTQLNVGNLTAWSWRQEEIRSLKRGVQPGVVRRQPAIEGYYIPNSTGSARTQPFKKIREDEKSKYLPHRIKVQKAREQREAEAKEEHPLPVKVVTELPKSSSRGKRADDRRTVKDLDRQREMLQTLGDDADVLRFNQLQKRKKPVKFARSAIHNWGLYSLERITASEMIIEYVGEKIRQEVADLREIAYTLSGIGSSYLFRIDESTVVDATKKGGIARFINHSCSPNCTAKIIRVGGSKRIVIYALRDIEKGELE